jgi:DNA-binding CsgD family transcriptional regulator
MTSRLFSEIAREAVIHGEPDDERSVRLTPREREVIDLISEGLSNKAIDKRLSISSHTVKGHLRNIMEKSTLHTRLQIAAYAHGRVDGGSSPQSDQTGTPVQSSPF